VSFLPQLTVRLLACLLALLVLWCLQEDLILPHHHTFYELIVNKARGKSGPLFDFGVKDDIRMLGDASMESQDVHAGKVRGLRHRGAAAGYQQSCFAAATPPPSATVEECKQLATASTCGRPYLGHRGTVCLCVCNFCMCMQLL
jgi:hypothetical protein